MTRMPRLNLSSMLIAGSASQKTDEGLKPSRWKALRARRPGDEERRSATASHSSSGGRLAALAAFQRVQFLLPRLIHSLAF